MPYEPEAQNAIPYIRTHYGVYDNIPCVCLNVAEGFCNSTKIAATFVDQFVCSQSRGAGQLLSVEANDATSRKPKLPFLK